MSKRYLIAALACVLAAACWIVALPPPLAAQTVNDGPGVTVDIGNAMLMHRTGVFYPSSALPQKIEGTVVLQVTLDDAGNVTDAHVVSGPEAFRKTALQSVLQWHFARAAAGTNRQVSITFTPPPAGAPTSGGVLGGILSSVPAGTRTGVVGGVPGGVSGGVANAEPQLPAVKSIEVYGIPEQFRGELLSSLPVRDGDALTPAKLAETSAAIRKFDEHLSLSIMGRSDGTELRIVAPGSTPPPPRPTGGVGVAQTTSGSGAQTAEVPGRIRVGGNVQLAKLISQTRPVYPPLAKQARISGVVRLNAIIAQDGTVKELTVISGHPLLVQAALDAVRQWVYQKTLLNGNPVEVVTQIDVNFSLSDQPPAEQQ